MKQGRRSYSAKFKAEVALAALTGSQSAREIAQKFDLHVSLVHAWKGWLAAAAPSLFLHRGKQDERNPDIRAMDRRLDLLRAEQEWMRRVVATMPRREKRAGMEDDALGLSVLRRANLLGLHRSGLYYVKNKTAAVSTAAATTDNRCDEYQPRVG